MLVYSYARLAVDDELTELIARRVDPKQECRSVLNTFDQMFSGVMGTKRKRLTSSTK